MPRKARQKSASGIYHVVIRGADRQLLFEEESDYQKYLEILKHYKEKYSISLYAYCLMDNHIHLVLNIKLNSLEDIFRKINTCYAVWFNMKYQRTGHLQQGRYHSEPIEDERYFLTAIRYVHQNPLKAGMEKMVGESYCWNSFYEYVHQKFDLIDSKFVFSFISPSAFIEFNKMKNEDTCLEIKKKVHRFPDDVARDIVLSFSKCGNCTEIANLNPDKLRECIIFSHEKGVSIRQLNRITGKSIGAIERMVK